MDSGEMLRSSAARVGNCHALCCSHTHRLVQKLWLCCAHQTRQAGNSRSLDVLTSSSLLARGTAYPSWLVGRCQGATEGCTVLQSALRRPLYEGVVALNGHQAANASTRPRRRIFPSECCTWPCKRASVSAPSWLARWWATVYSPHVVFFFLQSARWETGLQWVVLNLVGGANACLREFPRMWQAMETTLL